MSILPSDAELIAPLRRRDPAAFDALYTRHTDALYNTALRLAGDSDVAADVVHDTWLHAFEKLEQFEGRSAFRSWLTGILINRMRGRWRDERDVLPLDLVSETHTTPVISLEVDALDLERAIAALPPRYRAVLVLHDVEGFTHDEIALMLEIVPGTSKSQLSRARTRVRDALTIDQRKKAQ